jgi:hypothetical protein
MATEFNFAQLEGSCYCCGKKGHRSTQCPKKAKIAKTEWVINKTAEASFIISASKTVTFDTLVAVQAPVPAAKPPLAALSTPFGWMAMNIQMPHMADEMKEWVWLDTGSTFHVFCNPKLVTNRRKIEKTLNMTTNAGTFACNETANLPWNEMDVWLDPSSITNVLSFGLLQTKYRIT